MPYPNLPKSKWKKMERCVKKVRARGGVSNPYAVCHASIADDKKPTRQRTSGKRGKR